MNRSFRPYPDAEDFTAFEAAETVGETNDVDAFSAALADKMWADIAEANDYLRSRWSREAEL
jgi:hypothetical protein